MSPLPLLAPAVPRKLGIALAFVVSAVVTLTPVARADEPTPTPTPTPTETPQVAAQRLFDEALALLDQGRASEACPKFRESLALDPAVGTLLNIAACSKREGKLLQSATEYRHVLELNRTTADPERQQLVEAQARAALDEVEAKLGRVSVSVEPATATVLLDGESLAAGAPREVLAGEHVVRVEAPGFPAKEQRVDVHGRELASLSIALATPHPDANHPTSKGSAFTTAAWVTAALGVAAGTSSAVLFAFAADRASAIRSLCGESAAPPDCPGGSAERANELSNEGTLFQATGITLASLGGALLGTTVALAVLAGTTEETPITASAMMTPDGGFVAVGGRF
ncbi:MAG: PEGA domain-containing protein [Polyangiaceae bacterium]